MRLFSAKYFLFFSSLLISCFVNASHDGITKTILTPAGGTDVIIGNPEATETVDYNPKTGSFIDHRVNNLLTFGVDHHYAIHFPDSMEVRVKLLVQPYNSASSPGTPFYVYLDLNYNPFGELAYVDKDAVRFFDAYKFDFTIDSIYINGISNDTLPANLFIDGLIEVERYSDFSSIAEDSIDISEIDTFDLNCDEIYDELEIKWPTTTGAEEYQLEWTFINDYDTSITTFKDDGDLPYDFKNNSTRVSTNGFQNYYRIPILFDHGYVIFRVRAIGRDDSDPSKIIFGVWGLPDQGIVEDVVSSYFHVDTPHEGNKNWQASTTFAEEGKKKEVVSYFDGSLRNRQTVTRINSDNNTIVGETIYDHQGRPAITVLPVPVAGTECVLEDSANVLMYYPEFNKDDTLNAYSRNDFDVDTSICNAGAMPMDTTSGSSNYYSRNNLNKTGFQKYVPNANGHPFTQVEYTPDNTGRIRRQSGVGIDFQLGSGHETKYYYGQPNQIQLDRMFGSEVGDATHYKKNLVLDPNGQASVSYLDQEGRVIATSLAGDSTANLNAIDSEGSAAKELTVDLFAKNADGVSGLNSKNISGNSIEFSTQLLVPYSTTYTFDYDLLIDVFEDTCLADEICFNCVYDLTLKVIDECGVDLVELEDELMEEVVIGHFDLVNDTIVFNTECSDPTTFDTTKSIELVLPVGNYTIIKKLTVNNDAIDFYVNSYMDSSINECFMTLHDFEELYLSQIDTTDCYIDCEDCLEALGVRDEFVAQGKGSAFDYDREYAECQKLCPQDISLCEAAYQAMLMDMAPGGQYAHYIDSEGDVDPSGIRLSILNIYNTLPAHSSPSVGTWKQPDVTLNGSNYPYYLDDQNTRSVIFLVPDGVNYLPAVSDTSSTKVFEDANGDYYTYPENLLNVSDFILSWQSGWSRSLVQYHPEYCYYETCISYEEVVNTGDSLSSDDFDKLLMNTMTFQDAIDNKFIRVDHDTVVNPNNRLEDWHVDNTGTGKPWDPFVVRFSEYTTYASQLAFKFNFYTPGSTPLTMLEVASATVRCGALVNIVPTSTCFQFGRDFIPGGPSDFNDSIRNAEWNTLKNLYISYKNILKANRADNIALEDCESLNDCIGNDEFNPYESGMLAGGYPLGAYYNSGHPCSIYNRNYYSTKTQRFPDPENNDVALMDANEVMYQQYLLTGQCPAMRTFQDLFSALSRTDSLDADTVRLLNYPEFSSYLMAILNYEVSGANIFDYDIYSTGEISPDEDTLTIWATFEDGSPEATCPTRFIKNGTSFLDWDDIEFLTGMQYTGVVTGTHYYVVYAAVPTPDSILPYRFDTLIVTLCRNISLCNFKQECDANAFAVDLQNLLSTAATEGDLNGSNVNLQDIAYLPFSTPIIRDALGTPNDELDLNWDISNHSWLISDSTDTTRRIRIYLRELDPPTFNLGNLDSITGFFGVVSTYEHYFTIYARYGVANDTLKINAGIILEDDPDTTGISMGNCGLPEPVLCKETGHHAKADLEVLLQDILLNDPFEEDTDLYQNALFTPLLRSFVGDTTGITSSTYTHTYFENDLAVDTLHIDSLIFDLIGCNLSIWHQDSLDPELSFDSLTYVGSLNTMGELDEEGNFHDFYLPVVYSYGGSDIIDTLYGHSCFPLKNCISCPEEEEEEMIMMMSMSMFLPDSLEEWTIEELDSVSNFLNGYSDNTVELFLQYKNSIDSLNSNHGWSVGDSLYATPLGYVEYSKQGYNYIYRYYNPFIKNYIHGVDKHYWLTNPRKFILENGMSENVKVQYERYETAENRYNERAAENGLDPHTIKPRADFYSEKRGTDIQSFLVYLEDMPSEFGDPADDIDTYYGSMYSMMMLSDEDSCDLLYTLYLDAYTDFELYQDTNNTCFNYELYAPLYSQSDFEDNNLCCSDTGFVIFNQYIETILDTLQCPGPLPFLSSCDSIIDDDSTCLARYHNYLENIEDFNASDWADSMNIYLDSTLYPTFEMFLKTGRCSCERLYSPYIATYIDLPVDTSLADPMNIDEFCPLNANNGKETECTEAYELYRNTVATYNAWAMTNPDWPTFVGLTGSAYFKPNTYCYCVESYVANLNAIMEGIIPYSYSNLYLLSIGEQCSELTPECTPTAPVLGNFVSPILTAYSNPCVEYMTNMALMNAQNDYNDYVDSLATEIRSRYIEHCLSAVENFEVNYIDKEYHFTLYYYDQAGNLVKTVPPEGVQLLNMRDPLDDTAILVNNDRTYGTRTIFTSHLMETRYEYNSLNQLVKQSMPDHDKMTIWETTLPNGLDSRLEGTEVNFTNESNGYMSGYIDLGSGVTRGLLYRTSDGGSSWNKVDYTAGTNLKKIFWASSTVGYGVGTDGIALKTTNGGQSWSVLNGYVNHYGTVQLNCVLFTSTTTGVFGGNKGILLRTTDGGSTFTLINYTGKHSSDSIVSIAYNGSSLAVLSLIRDDNNLRPPYFVACTSSPTLATWTPSSAYRGTGYAQLQYLSNGKAITVGDDGNLAERVKVGSVRNWIVKETGTALDMKDLYFINPLEGIAIIDSVDGYGQIYKTVNGGYNWELLSEPGDYYLDLFGYKTSGIHKVIAVGKNGLAHRIILETGEPFGIIPLVKPEPGKDFNACWGIEQTSGETWILAGNNDGDIWMSKNANEPICSWVNTGVAVTSGLEDLLFKQFISGSDTTLSGTVEAIDGDAYPSFYNATGTLTVGAFSPAIPSSADMVDQVLDNANNRVYMLDMINKTIRMVSINGSAITTTATGLSAVTTIGNPNSLDYKSDTIYVVNKGGNVQYGVLNNTSIPPTIAWAAIEGNNFRFSPVRDIFYNPTAGVFYGCGDDGLLVERLSGGIWRIINSEIATDLNAFDAVIGSTGYIAGNNGKAYRAHIIPGANSGINITEINTPTSENLNDVALNGTKLYFGGNNGTLLYASDTSSISFQSATINMSGDIHGVSFKPSSTTLFAVGDESRMFTASGSTAIPQKNIFLPALRSVSFYDNEHGYILGDNFNIRYTNDAGASWQPVLPIATIGTSYTTMNKIRATGTNTAMAVGNNRTLYEISDLVATLTTQTNFSTPTSDHLYDAWQHGTTKFVIKGNASNGYLYQKVGAGAWTSIVTFTGKPLRSIWGFSNGNILVAGLNGRIAYYNDVTNDTTWFNAPTGTTTNNWSDIFFHDDLNGYVVGANGVVLRSKDFSLNSSGYHVFGSWTRMRTDDSLNTQTDTTAMTINGIGFGERYNGIMVGSHTTTPKGYHRRIHDESQLYSTHFFYDKLGRIVLSQNTKQFNKTPKTYSYTLFDELGRVVEAGEKHDYNSNSGHGSNSGESFSMIFGDTIATHFNPDVINDDSLMAWITNPAGIRTEVTHSWYDITDDNIGAGLPLSFEQNNLRKRIAHVTYEDTLDTDTTTYDYATHYTYDIHGNVNTLLQDNKKLVTETPALEAQQFKRMDYTYDLISGNVHHVAYQNDSVDAWHHRYEYDADNRITQVETSTDSVLWDVDGKYFYYAHGPLARTETGDLQVQGTDYAYTLQGWIKGVNSNTLDSLRDIGQDGNRDSSNVNFNFPRDVYGYSLNYFEGDYTSIDNSIAGTNHFLADLRNGTNKKSDILQNRYDLYNGNIGSMITTITDPTTREALPLGNAYKYDQLNRLLQARSFDNIDFVNNRWDSSGVAYGNKYYNKFTYDANGNILTQRRYEDAGAQIDDLTYRYAKNTDSKTIQNRLYHVDDAITSGTFTDDIDDMGTFSSSLATINTANTYSFTPIGELKKDTQEEILEIVWRVDGKVKEVYRTDGSLKKNLKFDYDPMGNRIAKHIFSSDSIWERSTYYTRDAQGNTMSVYEYNMDDELASFKLNEQHIYGSSRLGMRTDTLEMIAALPLDTTYSRTLGKKQYEFSNHLGNVLSVISDKKLPQDFDADDTVDYFRAEILTASDYSPFGVTLTNRNYTSSSYRYGFNGKEKDAEAYGEGNFYDYGFRMYDTRICRFWSVDPLHSDYPELSTYQFASNTPIWAIDVDGLEARIYTETAGMFGHTFISVGTGKDIIVYTYGRYAELGKQKGSANQTNLSGQGVLIKLTGQQATDLIYDHIYKYEGSVFEITDTDEGKVKDYFEEKFNSSDEKPTTGKYANSDDARVIDEYSLFGNNCTTISCDAIEEGGSTAANAYATSGSGASSWEVDIFSPSGLQDHLTNKVNRGSSRVKLVTGDVSKELNFSSPLEKAASAAVGAMAKVAGNAAGKTQTRTGTTIKK
jgi:RHS repeat-associated protein